VVDGGLCVGVVGGVVGVGEECSRGGAVDAGERGEVGDVGARPAICSGLAVTVTDSGPAEASCSAGHGLNAADVIWAGVEWSTLWSTEWSTVVGQPDGMNESCCVALASPTTPPGSEVAGGGS
jgi:hypothetical protein